LEKCTFWKHAAYFACDDLDLWQKLFGSLTHRQGYAVNPGILISRVPPFRYPEISILVFGISRCEGCLEQEQRGGFGGSFTTEEKLHSMTLWL